MSTVVTNFSINRTKAEENSLKQQRRSNLIAGIVIIITAAAMGCLKREYQKLAIGLGALLTAIAVY